MAVINTCNSVIFKISHSTMLSLISRNNAWRQDSFSYTRTITYDIMSYAIRPSAKGASQVGGSGGMRPQKIFEF